MYVVKSVLLACQWTCRQHDGRFVEQHMVHFLALLLKLFSLQTSLLSVCMTLPFQL